MAKHRMEEDRDRDEQPADERGARSKPKARGGSRTMWLFSRLLVVAVLFGALAFFAPLLISRTGVWKSVLASAAPKLAGKIDAAALELSWLAPIQIQNLVVRDLEGQPLAEVPLIKSRKSLIEIALNSSDLGIFDVIEPKAKITLRASGSNVEDLLAALPQSESQGGGAVGVGLQLVRGTIALDDQIAGRQWQLEGVALDVNWTAATNQPKTGKLAAAIRPLTAGAGSGVGQVAAEFSWQPGSSEAMPLGAGQAQFALQGVPTEIVEGGLRRFVADIRPQGPLTLKAACAWDDSSKSQRVAIEQLATPGLMVIAPALLGGDRPTFAITSGQADVQLAAGLATIRDLRLESNLIQLAGKGSANLAQRSATALRDVSQQPATTAPTIGDVEVTGQLNLAELARQLPGTIHLRPDTQLTSGVLQVSLVSREASGSRQWQGALKTDQIRATAAGRPVQFDQPIALEFTARQSPQGLAIDQLTGQASFLKLNGRGTLDEGGITASADLNQLVTDLGRLIDWGETRLAGSLAAELQWKRDPASGWTAQGDVQVRSFECSAPGMLPWKEPNLEASAAMQGVLGASSLELLKAAKLTVAAGADRLEADLTEPVKSPSAASIIPCKFTLRGDLASWMPRLQPFVPLAGWRMSGAIEAAGAGRLSAKACELNQTTLQLQQLDIQGPGVAIREPLVKIETSGAWDQPQSALTLGSTTFASSALALRADGLRLLATKEPSVVGLIDFRGDLGRLSSWLVSGGQPPSFRLGGSLTGRVEIGYRGQALAANWTTDVEKFAYLTAPLPATRTSPTALTSAAATPSWETVWEEPRVSFSGQGTFDPATTSLKIERTSLATANAGFSATGTLRNLLSTKEADLSGEVTYDLALVTQQIQALAAKSAKPGATSLPYGLDTLQLTGKQKRQFVLKGPLLATTDTSLVVSDALTGEASLGWEGAQYVGLIAGPADFRARLASGIIQVGPLDIPVSEGRLKTAPRIALNGATPNVVLDRGPLIENVRITPEMCSLWLKFVAPLLAEATRAEGKFSVSLEGADVPVSAPMRSSVAGTMVIHTAQIGPGPLAQQYVGLYQQVRSLLNPAAASDAAAESNRGLLVMPPQDVRFEVRDGAVYHRGLQLTIGNTVITTEGSVGIESQELNLVTNVPLQESWFQGQATLAAAFKGQSISIPVHGTLSQPRLDLRAVQDLTKQFAGAAVQGALNKQIERGQGMLNKELEKGQGALQNEFNKGLNKLFGPLQPQTPQPAPKTVPPAPRP